jgi:S-adenosyl methyltransferase
VHQVTQDVNRASRVVYVDNIAMVLAHSRALKTSVNTVAIEADLRDPRAILDHPGTRRLIDSGQPSGVLLVAVLDFISDDDDPNAIVAAICDALQPGSYLVLSHVTGASVAVNYKKVTPGTTLRGREEILRFFAGLRLIDRGLVQVPYWRPGRPEPADASKVWILGGVGRKPGPSSAERM